MADIGLSKAAAFTVALHHKKFAAVVKAVQETVSIRAPQIMVEELAKSNPPPMDRGAYKRGWKVARIPNGAVVYNDAPYAGVIEEGRRPGTRQPPTDVLMGWVKRKGMIKGRGKSVDAQARSLAFVVARAIKRRGLKGHFILKKGSQRLQREVHAAVSKALENGGREE